MRSTKTDDLWYNKSVMSGVTRRGFCVELLAVGATGLADGLAKTVPAEGAGAVPLKKVYIYNRRYLGNKYRLLEEIRRIVETHCEGVESFVDIFAGTGSVASAFSDKHLITNDILYSNYICHVAWFSGEAYDEAKVARLLQGYNALSEPGDNYMSEHFADTYFSAEDCRRIGYIREDIEQRYAAGEVNGRERALLIASLLYAMDKIANTVGHYDAYRKHTAFEKHLELRLPVPPTCTYTDNQCFNLDANVLAPQLGQVDVFFMDPPYNSRQYSDAYHVLENVARWEKPSVVGVARKMDRSALKSDYCTQKAEEAFAELVANVKARYLVLTYNNMAEQGNERSNAKLSDEAILRTLRAKGEVMVFHCSHKAFSAGKSSREDNVERIFLCKCRSELAWVSSPLNYTGGKFRILNQLLPHFPREIDTCVDLFCGGCNVGVNVPAKRVLCVDSLAQLIALFKTMKALSAEQFSAQVREVIARFGLSDSERNGYEPYGSNSSKGLGAFNKEPYLALRRHYATLADGTPEKSIALYVLIVYGFNNQIRFNAKGEYNLPVGKRDFNAKMQEKLRAFIDRLHARPIDFLCQDFRQLDLAALGPRDFVYADPPYLVTTASYNENGGWTEQDERDLLALLDRLHRAGCRFALSNVTHSNGRTNALLLNWLAQHAADYKVIEVQRDYSNANYQRKQRGTSREVLVINY